MSDHHVHLCGWDRDAQDWVPVRALPDGEGGWLIGSVATDPSVENDVTSDTVIKAGNGVIETLSVKEASLATGTIHDASSVAGANTSNMIAVLPVTLGIIRLAWPVQLGIVIKPGAGQKLAISYR